MKKIISALFATASLLASAGSQAATDLNHTSAITFDGITSSIGAAFGNGTSGKTFTESFTFSQGSAFQITSAIISITLSSVSALDITSFNLSGNSTTTVGVKSSGAGLQTWTLSAANLSSGFYTLSTIGRITGSAGGSFGGNISVAAVPEASTTAMMLGGLALIGMGAARRVRRRRDDSAPTGLMPA